ncbi:MAG TPA: UTP--glucose-1-phosphate uridylyltransferase GalU [Acidimicrobiales bacterium]|nr:UTP--glucose-1-phosphate uridylyltransferase GalU [Acidimicrobiales bacterium]
MTVRKAVIPAAGLGTRFLPATKATPKEMLAIVDKPAIQYVVEEAVAAGITDICIVTGRTKKPIEDHFDVFPELEAELAEGGKEEALAEVRAINDLASFAYVRQGRPLGLGHAVAVARHHVGDEPFAVLLPDDLMVDGGRLLQGMIAAHDEHAAAVIALKAVPMTEISSYGCPRVEPVAGRDELVAIRQIVEKPAPADAPSDLAATGRYVFPPAIFDALDRVTPGKGGEIQLTDAIDLLLAEQDVLGYIFSEGRHDIGNKPDFLRTTVALGAAHPDLGADFRAYLADFVRDMETP